MPGSTHPFIDRSMGGHTRELKRPIRNPSTFRAHSIVNKPIQHKTIPVVVFASCMAAIALAFMTVDEIYVAAPGFACTLMVLWLGMELWARDQKIPFFDVGIFCALATMVYSVYPLINYWVDGFQFGILGDGRLRNYNISPTDLGVFHLRHVLYLFCFVVFYSAFRGSGRILAGNVSTPSRSTSHIIVATFLILTSYFIFLQLATGVSLNTSYETEVFETSLAARSRLPLLILQISGKLRGILFVFKLALLAIVVSKCSQQKWRAFLFAWIALEIMQSFILKGSRTEMVLFVMGAALLYHRLVKPFTMRFLLASGISLFLFFIFLGIYRNYSSLSSLQSELSQARGGLLSGGNEFQGILGTGYDVLQIKLRDTALPWYLYINDFVKILPPQQLLPFEKISASDWYIRHIGMSGTGVGYMWGVISQSVIGFDWLELAIRGAILGYLLARLHRWYLQRQFGFFETLVYVFFCLKIYYTFRDTTFSLLSNLVWEIIPFYLILHTWGHIQHPNKMYSRSNFALHSRNVAYVRNLRKTNVS